MENSANKNETVILEQSAYASRVSEILKSRYVETPKAFVHTYGCQQNVSDSERLKGSLVKMGYELSENIDECDLVLYNTCAVREHAEDRVYGNIGALKALKRARPGMIIAVCGCMMQQQSVADRIKNSYPYVDILFGTHMRHRFSEFIYRRLTGSGRIFEIREDEAGIYEDMPINRDGKIKAWLPIMQGCNNFCTYCIVPYVRGRECSRSPEKVIEEARSIVAAGFKEITLLGQNVNSYGKGEPHGVNFAELIKRINAIEGDFRIRFMTSHPKDCTLELLDAMRDCEKVCHHLHLPLQSGSDRILKAMNRHYDSEQYMNLIYEARRRMPDIALTSDIIVGFPGETYEDFRCTLDVVKKVGYNSLFTFIYSKRAGTPAAIMPDLVSRKEKGIWFDELLRVQEESTARLNKTFVGGTYRVLCEDSFGEKVTGRTFGNTVIEFKGDASLVGTFREVKVTGLSSVLEGELI